MHQAIGPNHAGTGIAQDGELAVYDVLPDFQRVSTVVNANSYQTCVEGFELFCVLCELAQLACAVRSPVSTIEDQEHTLAAQRREAKGFAIFVIQNEVRRRLAHRGRNLWPGQVLARGQC